MFKKLGLLALSTIVLGSPLLSIASAADYSFQGDLTEYNYSPSSFTPTSDFTLSESDIKNITCSTNECDIYFHNDDFMCELGYSNDSWWASSCSDPFVAGVEYEVSVADGNPFDLFVMTDGQSSGGSDSDGSIGIPSGFTDSVNGLVSNFAGSIGNYAPTLILVGLGVVLLFTFWGVIRSWAVRMFSKKGR